MNEHDPRCGGSNDEKVLADVAEYRWHVVKVLQKDETPGWAFSTRLFSNFNRPELGIRPRW